ncbi:MAG: DUF4340 domain-containing protein [Pseudomonadota bacterium]|nr:MAG: DUF4340 domain-containing protein [Pseudomonadota bacterium]
MTARTLIILGVLTVMALVVALLVSNPSTRTDTGMESGYLLPELRARINDIESIDIVAAGGETSVTLRRERERWRVRERFDYEADFAAVHDLLRDLAEARIVEQKTDNPEWYGRLGVADIAEDGAAGVRVDFPGAELPGIILGDPDSAGIGRYARLADRARSVLIDRDPDVPTDPLEWLEKAIMDIPAADIEAVTLRHPDGETVELRPGDQEGSTWVVLGVPEGREARQAWYQRQTADALSSLNMENVRVHETLPDDAVRALFRTRDGLNFVATLFTDDDGHWVHFSVSAELPATDDGALNDDQAELSADAAAVDERLSPWQFSIDESRHDRMTRRLEDFLVVESDEP